MLALTGTAAGSPRQSFGESCYRLAAVRIFAAALGERWFPLRAYYDRKFSVMCGDDLPNDNQSHSGSFFLVVTKGSNASMSKGMPSPASVISSMTTLLASFGDHLPALRNTCVFYSYKGTECQLTLRRDTQYGRVLSGQGFTLLAHALRNKRRWGKRLGGVLWQVKPNSSIFCC